MALAVTFRPARADEPPGADLLAAMLDELTPLYGRIDVPGAPTATPEQLAPPGGSFLVGFADGAPGGLRRGQAPGRTGMRDQAHVRRARRRAAQGVARALLGALEDEARRLGYGVARLDTGPHQPDAEHLYRSAGYARDRELQREPVRELLGREAAGLSGRAPRPAAARGRRDHSARGRVRQVAADVADVEAARDVAGAVGDVEVDPGDEARARPRADRDVRAEVRRAGRRPSPCRRAGCGCGRSR